jgi:hypothetical protein
MATSVTYASSDPQLSTLVSYILPYINDVHGDGILNSNFVTAMLNAKGAKEVVDGGLEFWETVSVSQNSNFKWQGKHDDMNANYQDPTRQLRFPVQVFTGSVVINSLDKAMNKGKAAIKQYLTDLRANAKSSIDNQFNSALWTASPGTNEPASIPSIISATPTTGTIGGQTRSTSKAFQNGVYTTAISDIGSEAGLADIYRLRALYAVGQKQADMIVMPVAQWANLAAYCNTQRQYKADQTMVQAGIESIDIGKCTVGYEQATGDLISEGTGIPAGYMYGINIESGGLKIKVLADGNSKWSQTEERVGKTLNTAFYYEWFGNLVTRCPRANFVATSVA